MKKILFSLLLVTASTTAFAQFKVYSDGTTVAGTKSFSSNYHVNFESNSTISSGYNIGVAGKSKVTSTASVSCGVYGHAKNAYTGMNYGVAGDLDNNDNNGAGVIGSSVFILGNNLNGKYAGYFHGSTMVNGTLTANSIVQTSDLRLKENIVPLRTREGSALGKVLDMNVIEYNYKKIIPSMELPDTVSVEDAMRAAGISPEKKHIGLIAQDLQKLYPELVEEGQDGYLAVNYIELVPVLIRAIQELKQELDEKSDVQQSRGTAMSIQASNATSGNVLYQNTPNPFKEKTTIRFRLADDAQNAAICIFDLSGKLVKKLLVSSGDESVTVPGYELGEGMFLYTLMVNGQEIDTKRMTITK